MPEITVEKLLAAISRGAPADIAAINNPAHTVPAVAATDVARL